MYSKEIFQIEDAFLLYYQNQGYRIIPGSSLLDPSVPMTFVMSAGLAQVETSVRLNGGRTGSQYTLVQNCFRYFDMENVGTSPFHLSLFRMPGVFNFGPVSREICIGHIWKILTQVYDLSPNALWVTYFSGGEVSGLMFGPDQETYLAWQHVGIPCERIIGLNADHNFWKQSAKTVGEEHSPKCGANTEVFFDKGEYLKCGPKCRPGCHCGRFVELLNTLFITFYIDDIAHTVKPLDEPFTETVIGAERLSMLLQKCDSVFDIDIIKPLILHIENFIPADKKAEENLIHKRVIADHIRALVFLTADGAPSPGKGGRARLMRKLVREMLSSLKILGISDSSFLFSIVELVQELYSERHPRIVNISDKVSSFVSDEKRRFEHMLKRGFHALDILMAKKDAANIGGSEILSLEKNYGVPISLLERKMAQKKISFNRQDYLSAYKNWRKITVA